MEAPGGPPTMTYEQEKEEKLRIAREKLKQFRQRKKEAESLSSPSPVSNPPVHHHTPSSPFPPPLAEVPLGQLPMESVHLQDPSSRSVSVASSSVSAVEPSTPVPPSITSNTMNEYEETKRHYEVYCQTLSNQVSSLQETISSSSIAHREEMDKIKFAYEEKIHDLSNSVQICVSEKSELSQELDKSQKEVVGLKDQMQSLENRLQEALSSSAGQFEEAKKFEMKENELQGLKKELNDVNETVINQRYEISEITSKLKSKMELTEELENKYVETKSQLEMVELNLSQMRNSNPDELLAEKNEEISKLRSERETQEKRISELTAYIQQSNGERDQIINQYTSYSQQLVAQIEALNKTLTEKLEENTKLSESEKSLLSTVLNLENRLQELMNLQTEAEKVKSERGKENMESEEDLKTRLNELQVAHDQLFEEKGLLVGQCDRQESNIQELNIALEENLLKISSMETEMEMLRSNFETAPLNSNLMESMESDKVAASRAMSQNQDLKKQLVELQSALVNLTNSKAELMNELEDVKRQNIFLSKCANESEGVKAIFEEKNRTIKTLSDQLKRLLYQQEQQKLKDAQVLGKTENESENQRISDEKKELLSELENAKEQIRNLETQNSELKIQLSVQESSVVSEPHGQQLSTGNTPPSSVSSDGSYVHVDIPEIPSEMVSESEPKDKSNSPEGGIEEEEDVSMASSSTCSNTLSSASTSSEVLVESSSSKITPKESIPNLEMDVAHFKLQQKFHEAMKKIADLMNEKDYLEHIVVQLQEETETVGEYITLYQYQRSMQKKSLEEKEKQLQKVCRDREELTSKLDKLQKLLTHFVENKDKTSPSDGLALMKETPSETQSDQATHKHTPSPQHHSAAVVPSSYSEFQDNNNSLESKETANKILSLLNELGTNSALKDEFHPWFWGAEVGQLITI